MKFHFADMFSSYFNEKLDENNIEFQSNQNEKKTQFQYRIFNK